LGLRVGKLLLCRRRILGGIDLVLQRPEARIQRSKLPLPLHRHGGNFVALGAQQRDIQIGALVGQSLGCLRRLLRGLLLLGKRLGVRLGGSLGILGRINLRQQPLQAVVGGRHLVGAARGEKVGIAALHLHQPQLQVVAGLGKLRRGLGDLVQRVGRIRGVFRRIDQAEQRLALGIGSGELVGAARRARRRHRPCASIRRISRSRWVLWQAQAAAQPPARPSLQRPGRLRPRRRPSSHPRRHRSGRAAAFRLSSVAASSSARRAASAPAASPLQPPSAGSPGRAGCLAISAAV
jgi:hypothetical protein